MSGYSVGFHLLFNSHVVELHWPPNLIPPPAPQNPQCYAARRQQGSPRGRNILVLARSSLPSTPPTPLAQRILNMANDFCRFLSTRHARGIPGPPEEVEPPPKVVGVGSESQTSYSFCALTPCFQALCARMYTSSQLLDI